jgi:phage tail sheath gpL-like
MNWYRVWLRSVPSPAYEHYDGYVDVTAESEDDAPARAVRRLRQTSFPDRSAACWRVEKVERR